MQTMKLYLSVFDGENGVSFNLLHNESEEAEFTDYAFMIPTRHPDVGHDERLQLATTSQTFSFAQARMSCSDGPIIIILGKLY